ncbi:hypothetical protein ACFL59_15230 [Planctomycetota bacterium]
MRRHLVLTLAALFVLATTDLALGDNAGEKKLSERGRTGTRRSEDKATKALRPAVVTDENNVEMRVEDAAIVEPPTGLLAGGSAKRVKDVSVWRGAHQILVDPADIVVIESSGEYDGQLLKVKLQLQNGKKVSGAVNQELELHGKVEFGGYKIKLSRVRRVVFRN